MGRNQRLRKIEKIMRIKEERQAQDQRRRERISPIVTLLRRLTITTVSTCIILYAGVQVNNHLEDFVMKLKSDLSLRQR